MELAQCGGLDVSLDLIFGVPGETPEVWQADLDAALQLEPDHISTYGLTFEQGTTFWNRLEHGELAPHRRRVGTGDVRDRDRSADGRRISSTTKCRILPAPASAARHNEVYWTGGEYFAAGPSAARHIAGVRETNHRSVTTWLQRLQAGQSPVAEQERLPPEERARELLVFALRRLEGVERNWFLVQTGYEINELIGDPLAKFVASGLLHDDGRRVRLTRQGLLVSDSIWPHFLESGEQKSAANLASIPR